MDLQVSITPAIEDQLVTMAPWMNPFRLGPHTIVGYFKHHGLEQTVFTTGSRPADLAEAERYLGGVTTSPELEGVPTESVVRFGPTVSTILAVAAASQADLIAMCSHGYTGFKRRIMGSVAERVVRLAPCPVLTVRHPEHEFVRADTLVAVARV